MRIVLFLCILFLEISVSRAQIRGIVVDGKKGQPLSGVNIYMQKDSIGIGVTDIKGEFRFAHNKMGLSDTIIFSYVGYSSFKCTLSELRHLEYKVSMYELPQLLHEVVVSGERPPVLMFS